MCDTRNYRMGMLLAPLLLALAVGVYSADIGECNGKGGICVKTYDILRVEGDQHCHKVDQIDVNLDHIHRECGTPNHVCCNSTDVRSFGRRPCDKNDTPKKCKNRHGGLCQNDCDTLKIDGICRGASCTCCVQKARKCEPKKEHADKHGFCVSKRKHCVKSGGMIVRKGCDCKNGKKGHLCYEEKHEWHWSYEGEGGPEFWKDYFPLCGLDRQSPIDIISTDAQALTGVEPFHFTLYDDQPDDIDIKNNGHSAVVYWNDLKKPFVSGGGLDSKYILAQFHFHWGKYSTRGSEHLIDSTAYPIELHLVHYKADYGSLGEAVKYGDGLAVLGIMFEVGEENAAIKPIVEQLPNIKDKSTEVNIKYEMAMEDFLPSNTDSFYRYLGSLTTPSCNEVVVWTVFDEPAQISEEQLEEFRKLMDGYGHEIVDNFRPVQELKGRTVSKYSGS